MGPLWRKHDADRRAHRRRPGVAGPAGLPRQHAVVLFCSDHGDCLGEHGLIQKWAPYDCITRTPLIAWSRQGLGAGAGATVEGLCQLFDVGPTILDLAGCATPKTYEARSLYPDCAGMRQQLLDNLREWLLQSNYVTRDYQAQAR